MSRRGGRGLARWPVLLGVALAAALAWLLLGAGRAEPGPPATAAGPASAGGAATAAVAPAAPAAAALAQLAGAAASGPGLAAAAGPLTEAERRARRALWQGRLERASEALQAYEQAARYPHESRPAREHPDQLQPFAPVTQERSLRVPGGTATPGVRLVTTQERTFLAGADASRVTLALQDASGQPLALRVQRAVLHEVTPPGRTASTPEFVMPINDQGQLGDAVAGDGVLTATVQPALQGFAGYAGLVRLTLQLDYAGQPGFVYFDFIVSPEQAARWLPGVREGLEQGSLAFYLKADVQQAGRYVVSARVDDANGRTVALALFNAELQRGEREIRLPVFGRLVLDEQPAFPLKLRDVEAFLLKPDTYPDRVMLPRLAGVVHTSRSYALADFSPALWSSDERERYLAELGRDLKGAQDALAKLGPGP
jgi:hypothetical protein